MGETGLEFSIFIYSPEPQNQNLLQIHALLLTLLELTQYPFITALFEDRHRTCTTHVLDALQFH